MENGQEIDDVLNRRIKNRERQRRYRARKRQEADTTNAVSLIQQPQTLIGMQEPNGVEVQKQLTSVSVNDMSRVYCKRNWKKDARLAHLSSQPTLLSTFSSNSPVGLSHESEVPHLLLQLRGEAPTRSEFHMANSSSEDKDKTEAKTKAPIRRNWKADARNKCA